MLARHPLRRRVPAHPILLGRPCASPPTSIGEVEQLLAGETVVADVAHGPLDARLVLRPPLARRINVEAASLRILQKAVDDARLARVGGMHDRLGAIGNNDEEHPVVELPRDFARLDRRLRALGPARIDELVARDVRREDPRAELATPTVLVARTTSSSPCRCGP